MVALTCRAPRALTRCGERIVSRLKRLAGENSPLTMRLQTQRTFDNYVGRLGIAALRPAAMLLGAILRRDHRLAVGKEVVWMKLLGVQCQYG